MYDVKTISGDPSTEQNRILCSYSLSGKDQCSCYYSTASFGSKTSFSCQKEISSIPFIWFEPQFFTIHQLIYLLFFFLQNISCNNLKDDTFSIVSPNLCLVKNLGPIFATDFILSSNIANCQSNTIVEGYSWVMDTLKWTTTVTFAHFIY